MIETYKRLATSYAQSRNYDCALENYFQALKIQSLGGDDKGTAQTLERVGDVYKNLVNKKKANEFYLKAIRIYELLDAQESAELSKLKLKHLYVTQIIPR